MSREFTIVYTFITPSATIQQWLTSALSDILNSSDTPYLRDIGFSEELPFGIQDEWEMSPESAVTVVHYISAGNTVTVFAEGIEDTGRNLALNLSTLLGLTISFTSTALDGTTEIESFVGDPNTLTRIANEI